MKKTTIILTCAALVCAHILYGDNITIGSKSYPSQFDDTSLSGDMQRVICSDLSRYLSYSPYLDMLFDMSEQGNEYPLRPIGNAPHARNVLDNVKLVKLSNGSYRIDIAKDLTDSYREILKENPNASTQILNAMNFISSFNSGTVTNLSLSEKCRLFRTTASPAIPTQGEEISSGLQSYWCTRKYSLPAIIDWHNQPIWKEHPSIVIIPVRVRSSKTKGVLESNTHFLGSISNEWFFIAL